MFLFLLFSLPSSLFLLLFLSLSQGFPSRCPFLIVGDDNFGFSVCYSETQLGFEASCCLSENMATPSTIANAEILKSRGIPVHFGVNPAMIKNLFSPESFSRLLFVLPGVSFGGCPSFIDKDSRSSMFKLRLHLYIFGFIKSSKGVLVEGGQLQFIWPIQEGPGVIPAGTPWPPVDIDKLGE